MNEVDKALEELKNELDNLPLIQEYLLLKKAISENEELKKMRIDIARLQYENKKDEHDNLLKIYNSHPLVINYQTTKEEVKNLLLEIRNILSD